VSDNPNFLSKSIWKLTSNLNLFKECAHIDRCSMVTGEIPDWWVWAYWVSPLTYGFNALAVNEMLAPRWMHPQVNSRSFSLEK